MKDNEFEDFIEKPKDSFKTTLNEKVEEMGAAAEQVAAAEGDLKSAKAQFKFLSEVVIPGLLDDVGLKSCETSSGKKVKVQENIRASIPAEKELDAFAWLEENGHGSVIKNQIIIALERGEDDLSNAVADALNDLGVNFDRKRGVHPMTLGALIKELLEEGVPVPLDLFGAFRQRVAKVGK